MIVNHTFPIIIVLWLSSYDYRDIFLIFACKLNNHMKNPFVTNGYVSPEYFCDREKETAKIVSLLTNENNIALISPRRLAGNQGALPHFHHRYLCHKLCTRFCECFRQGCTGWTTSKRKIRMGYLLECTGLPSFRNNIRHEWTAYLGNRSGSYN